MHQEKIKWLSFYFISLLFVFFAFACNDKSNPENEKTTGTDIENESDVEVLNEIVNREYIGTINENLKIKMELKFSGEDVSGTYRYEGKKEDLTVNGQFINDILTLNEYDSKGNITGSFEGNLTVHIQIVGTWSNPQNTKNFNFVLEEVTNDLPEGKNISGAYSKGDGDIDILYIGDDMVKFQGLAFWNNSVTGGCNTGEIAGIEKMVKNEIHYSTGPDEYDCVLTIKITENGLAVTEEKIGTCGGMNVTFNGDYEKVSDEITSWDTYNWMNIY
ncbi:MAG: hypothetical protein JXA68_02155 [Ignavibacteriales bacterium]|nr:hypothetical protein [Ignavibacteriales bacterium]